MRQAVIHEAENYLQAVIALSRVAGEVILEIYQQPFAVDHKMDGSPLTQADRAAHELILQQLQQLTPQWPVQSEESGSIDTSERQSWQTYWLVDPLDGTKEFVKRNDEFTVNIALIHAGEPLLGVVYTPVFDLCHWALSDHGSWKTCKQGPPEAIRVRSYTGGMATVLASRSHMSPAVTTFLQALHRKEGDYQVERLGSSLKMCRIAEGLGDIYPRLGLTSEWDTAAAQAIVVEAGGLMMDLDGLPLRYNKEDILNPWFIAVGDSNYRWLDLLPSPAS